jgi:hypothetical protein
MAFKSWTASEAAPEAAPPIAEATVPSTMTTSLAYRCECCSKAKHIAETMSSRVKLHVATTQSESPRNKRTVETIRCCVGFANSRSLSLLDVASRLVASLGLGPHDIVENKR